MIKKTQERKTNQINISLVIITLLLILFYVLNSKAIFVVILFISFLVITIQPSLGIGIWLLCYGFYYSIEEIMGVKQHFFLIPILLYSVLIFIIKQGTVKVSKGLYLFFILMVGITLLSLLNSRELITSVTPFVLINLNILLFIFITGLIRKDSKILEYVNQAIVLAMIAAFFSVIFSTGLTDVGRLSIGGNVRKMANIVSPAIIILFLHSYFLENKTITRYTLPFNRSSNFILLLLSTSILIMTVSRGAILTVIVTILLFVLINLYWGFITKRGIYLFFLTIFLIPLFYIFIPLLDAYILDGRLARVSLNKWKGNPRLDIWKSGIEQLNSTEYLFGSGMGTYRELEVLTGHSYYAHSVYIDTLVTIGIPAFIILASLIIIIFITTIKNRNPYGLSIIILTFILYLTHGTLSGSTEFWIFLSISLASNHYLNRKSLIFSKEKAKL